MDMLSWYKKHNLSLEAIGWIEDLKKEKPYTDEEITTAIEEAYRVGSKCGVTFEEVVAFVVASETMLFEQKGGTVNENLYCKPKRPSSGYLLR